MLAVLPVQLLALLLGLPQQVGLCRRCLAESDKILQWHTLVHMRVFLVRAIEPVLDGFRVGLEILRFPEQALLQLLPFLGALLQARS